ncbi:hypothetical protein IB211_03319c [Intestinimonas butyriciproducens]|uniref:Uncharacterized protein n=1 Tax=Intestinimonas butyriciproducens TaxID=1297617 RepID=A0A0S2W8Q8_9FIRM|nr:hypothetical protein IB211_03319c [Intestinimonas butyriciproducens]
MCAGVSKRAVLCKENMNLTAFPLCFWKKGGILKSVYCDG